MTPSNASLPVASLPMLASRGRRRQFPGLDHEKSRQGLLVACSFATLVVIAASCGSELGSPTDGGASCSSIQDEYAAALAVAQQCTVGTSSCDQPIRASFWCNCTTFVSGSTLTLLAIQQRYQASGCQTVCNGTCLQAQSLSCLSDATSPTGGRCQATGVLSLNAADDGGTFSVPIGGEVDIILQTIGPGDYSAQVMVSSDIATVLEVAIPAGPVNPGGPRRLYRLRALSAGRVQFMIPFESAVPDSPARDYIVTIDIG